jgi:hypothetical protein
MTACLHGGWLKPAGGDKCARLSKAERVPLFVHSPLEIKTNQTTIAFIADEILNQCAYSG